MAKKSFNTKITNSDDFIRMSSQAQALYFHLWVNADEDGLVSKRICSLVLIDEWYLKELIVYWFCKGIWDSIEVIFNLQKKQEAKEMKYLAITPEMIKIYGKDMIDDFVNYRTEKNDKWQQKWQLQKFFEVSKRLVTRNRNNSTFSTTHGSKTKNWYPKREVGNRLTDSHGKDYLKWTEGLWIKSI